MCTCTACGTRFSSLLTEQKPGFYPQGESIQTPVQVFALAVGKCACVASKYQAKINYSVLTPSFTDRAKTFSFFIFKG